MAKTLINGKSYTHAQIVATIAGVPIASISEINYKEAQDKVNNYGLGVRPVSRGHGTIDANGDVTMSMNDIEAIRDAAPNGSLLAVPAFKVTVTFVNAQKVVTHELNNCEFTEDGVESKTGDTDIKMKFPLVISDINFRP